MDLADDLRYSYFSDDRSGPELSDMITFLCGCPELCRNLKCLTVFQLGCLCFSQYPASVSDVRFGSVMTSSKFLIQERSYSCFKVVFCRVTQRQIILQILAQLVNVCNCRGILVELLWEVEMMPELMSFSMIRRKSCRL